MSCSGSGRAVEAVKMMTADSAAEMTEPAEAAEPAQTVKPA